MTSMKEKIPMPQALLMIFVITVMISGTTAVWWSHHLYSNKSVRRDPRYIVRALQQESTTGESLPTEYLAELLGIAVDLPCNMFAVNVDTARDNLLMSPVIADASVETVMPDALRVHYTMYTPFTRLGDYSNTALDKEGVPFPLYPYYTEKVLPALFLGVDELRYNAPLDTKEAALALAITKSLMRYHFAEVFDLIAVDTSNAYNKSYGKRDVVVTLRDGGAERLLRLTADEYRQQLGNYMQLRDTLDASVTIIDMRIPQLAFFR